MTDNNEATAWNGVMGGGNAPAPEKCAVSKTESIVVASIATAIGFVGGVLASHDPKPKR